MQQQDFLGLLLQKLSGDQQAEEIVINPLVASKGPRGAAGDNVLLHQKTTTPKDGAVADEFEQPKSEPARNADLSDAEAKNLRIAGAAIRAMNKLQMAGESKVSWTMATRKIQKRLKLAGRMLRKANDQSR